MDDYKRGAHTKYSMKVHLIFVTKYRKKLFWGKAKDDVKQFVFDAASKMGCEIIQMETDVDHIHVLLGYRPQLCISDIVRELKQYSTYRMWKYPQAKLYKYYWKRYNLWSDGYFACSIGQASQATIEKYIQDQG